MATYQELTDGRPDGAHLGQDASDKVALHGATPTVQSAVVAAITVTGVTALIGYANASQFADANNAINSILACLKAKGLMASS